MRLALIAAYFVLAFLVLNLTDSVRERIGYTGLPPAYVWREYLTMTCVVTAIILLLVPGLFFWVEQGRVWPYVGLEVLTGFVLLSALAIGIGTSPTLINKGPTEIISGFFAEVGFLRFILQDAIILSLMGGGYYWWALKSR